MTASHVAKPAPRPVSARRAKRAESHTARQPPAGVRRRSSRVGNPTALPVDYAHLYELARTEYAEAEARARALETIFATMSVGVVVTDRHGKGIRANQTYRRLVGLDQNGAAGETSWAECSAQIELRNVQGQPISPACLPSARLLRGEVLDGPTAMELTLRALDGRSVDVQVTGVPLRTRGEGIIGTVATYRDITQQRNLERRSAEALQAFLGVAEALTAPDAAETPTALEGNAVVRRVAELAYSLLGCQRMSLAALDPETERLLPAFGLGWTMEAERQWKAQGNRYRLGDYIPAALIRRLRAGEVVVVDDAATVAAMGPHRQEVSQTLLAPVRAGSQLIGVLGLEYGDDSHLFTRQEQVIAGTVARLCAALVARERRLREREAVREDESAARETIRRLEIFMAAVSHELRTPLTVTKAYQQLAEQYLDICLPDVEIAAPVESALRAARESLAQAKQASGRLTDMLNDLLQVSSARAGKLRICPQPCDIIEIVNETIRQVQRTNPTREVRLLPATQHAPTIADPDRIAQVVTNYLTNAFKYSPTSQPVEVLVNVRGRAVRVLVRDQGPGLSAADKRAIWEGFYQAPGVPLQRGSEVGLGVGLYICKTIIEQHGGQVGVDSTVGRGSTFWFTLPLSADAKWGRRARLTD